VSLEDLLRDRVFLSKVIMIGFLASLVFIGIGLFVIVKDIIG